MAASTDHTYPEETAKAPVKLRGQFLDTATGNIHNFEDHPGIGEEACKALETGSVIYFPQSPIRISADDILFLLTQRQLETSHHKNIAYRPMQQRLTGVQANSDVDIDRLRSILANYSRETGEFLQRFLTPYPTWQWDYASYRPLEEQHRKLRLNARNDLLHVDSFPTRPTYGSRILRFFVNLHPHKMRIWETSDPFEALLPQFKDRVPLKGSLDSRYRRDRLTLWQRTAKMLGLRQSACSPYDRWMSAMHNTMKRNATFQQTARKDRWEFPPGSAWMVMTDTVSHSVQSGQYALEQTILVPPEVLCLPEKAPINLLKKVYGNNSTKSIQ